MVTVSSNDNDINDNNESNDLDIVQKIQQCTEQFLQFLDLTQCKLLEIPSEMISLSHIEMLYLEGNGISTLPIDFFSYFPLLKWLDLRSNNLLTIPAENLAEHSHLKVLLLQSNNISELPVTLSLCQSLQAISLSDNPIIFPPQEVIVLGLSAIMLYLRTKLNDSIKEGSDEGENQNEEFLNSESYQEDGNRNEELLHNRTIKSSPQRLPPAQLHAAQYGVANQAHGFQEPAAITTSAKLHEPVTHYQIRQQYMERMSRGAGAHRKAPIVHRTQTERHNLLVNLQPEPPGVETIERRMLEDKRASRRREVQERQDAILQRRRDQESLRGWREQGKRLQQQKYFEQMQKTRSRVAQESEQRLESAPFDLLRGDLRMQNSEQHRLHLMSNILPEERPKPLSPEALAIADDERRAKEAALREKIQKHTKDIYTRKVEPKGDPKVELEVAQRNMQIVQEIQKEVEQRRRELDHQFQAFNKRH